jgi:hypothetical protein
VGSFEYLPTKERYAIANDQPIFDERNKSV